jgi:hypothetical protein
MNILDWSLVDIVVNEERNNKVQIVNLNQKTQINRNR